VRLLLRQARIGQQVGSWANSAFCVKGAAVNEWRHYLESAAPFALKLLSPPLSHRRTKASLTRRQARWVEFTLRCAITAEHGDGKINVARRTACPAGQSPRMDAFKCTASRVRAMPQGPALGWRVRAVASSRQRVCCYGVSARRTRRLYSAASTPTSDQLLTPSETPSAPRPAALTKCASCAARAPERAKGPALALNLSAGCTKLWTLSRTGRHATLTARRAPRIAGARHG